MISIRSQSGKATTYLTDFSVDYVSDILDLPKFPTVAKGSRCLCIEDGSTHVLGGDNIWHQVNKGGGSGSGSGSSGSLGDLTEDDFAQNEDINDWWEEFLNG